MVDRQGADFSGKVAAFPQPGKITGYLLALQAPGRVGTLPARGRGASTLVPFAPGRGCRGERPDALRARKAEVIPVAAGSHYLLVNFLNAVDITDKDLALLLPLRQQLVWLKLGNQPVGDSGMAVVGKCAALTVLHLNDTRITDKGPGAAAVPA